MDREQAKVITEYDHLISILIGLLLPPIGRNVESWSLQRAAGKDQLELHNSEERANRNDEDMLSCVVKFIVLTFVFSPPARVQRRERSGFMACCTGHPSSPPTDQSMWLISQRHAVGKLAVHQRSADTLNHPHLQPYQHRLIQGIRVHTCSTVAITLR